MQSINELSLAELPVHDPAFAADPLPYLDAARKQHRWLAKSDVGYLVHGYQAIKELYHMDDKLHFSSSEIIDYMGARGTPWGRFNEELMITQQGSEHDRLRGNVASAFSPRNINRFRGLMRDTVSQLLDEWVPRGGFDFAEFAANYPVRVMCGILGFPVCHRFRSLGTRFLQQWIRYQVRISP